MPACDRDLLLKAASWAGRQIVESDAWRQVAGSSQDVTPHAAFDLYAGPPGLALFWAAMARVMPEEREVHAERSLQALAPTRRLLSVWLAQPAGLDAERIWLGGLCGLGGALYALTCAGVLLDRPEFLAEAVSASSLVTPERIARDRKLDFVEGTAGMILALLSLENVLGSSRPGEREGLVATAMVCGEHLLKARSRRHEDFRVWGADEAKPPFCGFAHGASGMAYALLRLYDCTRRPELLDAALEAMAFERRLFRPDIGNWPPFAEFPRNRQPLVSWCWGAPGIALGRLAMLEILDGPELRDDIQRGLETTLRQRQTREDHVCCGNLGRAQVLAFAARRLEDLEMLAASDQLTLQVLRCAKGRGGFDLPPFFFKGGAGVGYALLDLAAPGDLPLPLLLSPPH